MYIPAAMSSEIENLFDLSLSQMREDLAQATAMKNKTWVNVMALRKLHLCKQLLDAMLINQFEQPHAIQRIAGNEASKKRWYPIKHA